MWMTGTSLTSATSDFVLPTYNPGHWGFSSVGGQLGGWTKSTLQQLSNGMYQAHTVLSEKFVQPSGFGTFANYGNSVPYANLELWVMGLIPDTELLPVDVAEGAAFVTDGSDGKFTASQIRTYSPAEIIARTTAENRPTTSTPRAIRGIVVLVTRSPSIDAGVRAALNSDIEQFSSRSEPSGWGGLYNFWTATGQRASLHLATASELRGP